MLTTLDVKEPLLYYHIALPEAELQGLMGEVRALREQKGGLSNQIGRINKEKEGKNWLAELVAFYVLKKEVRPDGELLPVEELGLSSLEFLAASRHPGMSSESRMELLKNSANRYFENVAYDSQGRQFPDNELHASKAYHLGLLMCTMYEVGGNPEYLKQSIEWVQIARANGFVTDGDLVDPSLHDSVVRTDVMDAQLRVYKALSLPADERESWYLHAVELAGSHEGGSFYHRHSEARLNNVLGRVALERAIHIIEKPDHPELMKALSYFERAQELIPKGELMWEIVQAQLERAESMIIR
jgi:hypothetical protein